MRTNCPYTYRYLRWFEAVVYVWGVWDGEYWCVWYYDSIIVGFSWYYYHDFFIELFMIYCFLLIVYCVLSKRFCIILSRTNLFCFILFLKIHLIYAPLRVVRLSVYLQVLVPKESDWLGEISDSCVEVRICITYCQMFLLFDIVIWYLNSISSFYFIIQFHYSIWFLSLDIASCYPVSHNSMPHSYIHRITVTYTTTYLLAKHHNILHDTTLHYTTLHYTTLQQNTYPQLTYL